MAKFFACGKNKTVLRSDDNGVSWQLKNSGIVENVAISCIDSWDGNTVVCFIESLSSGSAKAYRSTNSGDSWAAVPLSQSGAITAFPRVVKFVSATKVYAVFNIKSLIGGVDTYAILVSTDAGLTWDPGTAELLPEVVRFDASDGGYLSYGVSSLRLKYSTNDGASFGNTNFAPDSRIQAVRYERENEGVLIVATTSKFYKSTDFGANFVEYAGTKDGFQTFNNYCLFVNDRPYTGDGKKYFFYVSGKKVFYGEVDTLVQGESTSPATQDLHAIAFISGDIGVAVGNGGQIVRTTNAFDSASIVASSVSADLLAIVAVPDPIPVCDINIEGVDADAQIGSTNGKITVTASGSTCSSIEYRISSPYQSAWQDSNEFSVPSGSYNVQARCKDLTTCVDEASIVVPSVPNLSAQISKTDCTAVGSNDGTISISNFTGSGSYEVLFTVDASSYSSNGDTVTKSGFAPGSYEVIVTDIVTGQYVPLTISINDPAVIPEDPKGTFFQVALACSIKFVVRQEIDNNEVLQTPDNRLFCEEYFPGFECANYYQKVCKSDRPVIQFNSNYPTHSVTLKNYETKEAVRQFNVELKEQNIDITEDFAIRLRALAGFPDKTRIDFIDDTFPIPLSVGDQFEILNSLDGFNGTYSITEIGTDSSGLDYFVINTAYGISSSSSNATGRFDSSFEDFNVFESLTEFLDQPDGTYYIEILAQDNYGNTVLATSEPIDLKVTHPDTVLIEYKNIDNAYDITWTTGYTGRIRVEGILFKRLPGGERTLSRDSDFSLVKVSARKQRVFLFETYMLPPWMHEKLSLIFDTDFWTINNVQYQASEGYSEPDYLYEFKLANSSIKVEQVGWFNKYNSNDIGTVNDGGFLLTETGFIKI